MLPGRIIVPTNIFFSGFQVIRLRTQRRQHVVLSIFLQCCHNRRVKLILVIECVCHTPLFCRCFKTATRRKPTTRMVCYCLIFFIMYVFFCFRCPRDEPSRAKQSPAEPSRARGRTSKRATDF